MIIRLKSLSHEFPIMCSIDNAIYNTYLPEKLIFQRNGLNNTIPDGNEYCESLKTVLLNKYL